MQEPYCLRLKGGAGKSSDEEKLAPSSCFELGGARAEIVQTSGESCRAPELPRPQTLNPKPYTLNPDPGKRSARSALSMALN